MTVNDCESSYCIQCELFYSQIDYFRAHLEREFTKPDEFLRGCYCLLFSAELQFDVNLITKVGV